MLLNSYCCQRFTARWQRFPLWPQVQSIKRRTSCLAFPKRSGLIIQVFRMCPRPYARGPLGRGQPGHLPRQANREWGGGGWEILSSEYQASPSKRELRFSINRHVWLPVQAVTSPKPRGGPLRNVLRNKTSQWA